ncbi:transcription initiation factor TFIID subunit 4-like [Pteropus medius]|uniref:transcription initiation factor TFIID subunit 4-like n=1 Tax=Pteropus vampyrus TaxID=132908 RepID=UPI00196B7F45|nr:transcription initiation factor TFIID subunit 4-like [Pteropus giganteus]
MREESWNPEGSDDPGSPAPPRSFREFLQPPTRLPAAAAPRGEQNGGRCAAPAGGWKPQCGPRGGGRGGGPPGAPGPARPAPPRPSAPRTYPAGRAPGAPAVVISEGGGQRAPAGRQLRPRCCRRNPRPLLCSGAADAAAGEGRARGGEGGGAGPGHGLPTRAVEPQSPPACGLRPNSRLRQMTTEAQQDKQPICLWSWNSPHTTTLAVMLAPLTWSRLPNPGDWNPTIGSQTSQNPLCSMQIPLRNFTSYQCKKEVNSHFLNTEYVSVAVRWGPLLRGIVCLLSPVGAHRVPISLLAQRWRGLGA